MYAWDKQYINILIKHLKKRLKNNKDNKTLIEIIKSDIYELRILKYGISNSILKNNNIKNKLENNEKKYKELRHYNNIINPAIKKYSDEPFYNIKYKKILTSKDDIMSFTLDSIKNINKNWAKYLEPWITNKYTIDYKKNNNNYIIYLTTMKQYFISLKKNNNICDYIDPTHEFFHVLWFILNHNAYGNIESEFLSILGEFITTYEMKINNLQKEEVIKYEIDNIIRLFSYISDMEQRKKLAKLKSDSYKDLNINKDELNNILSSSLSYDYDTIISYFLAIELFEIYKTDKEKCIYIVENIIKSNDKLNKKLKDNNIILYSNDEQYIKQLKKEYETINNL